MVKDIGELVRIFRREGSRLDYVIYGSDFVVHPKYVSNPFPVIDLQQIVGMSEVDEKANAYKLIDVDGFREKAQLFSIPQEEYKEALRVQNRYHQEVLVGK